MNEIVVVEEGDPTYPSGTTPEMLKSMGIDMTVSKQDILNMVAQQLKDQTAENLEHAQADQKEFDVTLEEKQVALLNRELKRVAKKPQVVALVLLDLCGGVSE